MCDFSNGLKFSTCTSKIKYRKQEFYRKVRDELVKIPNKKNDNIPLIYIWHLFRYIGKQEEKFELGQYKLPSDNIGNGLNVDWILLNLNVENCFDFNYTPSEGDNLFVTQNIELAPYISFIFKNSKWSVDHYDPFREITEHIREGKIIETDKKRNVYE